MPVLSPLSTLATPLVAAGRDGTVAAPAVRQTEAAVPPVTASARITLSPPSSGGATGAATGRSRHDDIDDSDLPDGLKAILRQMREIQAQLRQAMDELRELMADSRMDAEQRRLRVQAAQARITALLGAQSELNAQLLKRLRAQPLSTEQQHTLGRLLMAPVQSIPKWRR